MTTTITPTPLTTDNFAEGARVALSVLSGYKLVQHRPFECRTRCECGECNGTTTIHEGTSEGVIYYADNSIEATVLCDDGQRRLARLKAPSGDVCF